MIEAMTPSMTCIITCVFIYLYSFTLYSFYFTVYCPLCFPLGVYQEENTTLRKSNLSFCNVADGDKSKLKRSVNTEAGNQVCVRWVPGASHTQSESSSVCPSVLRQDGLISSSWWRLAGVSNSCWSAVTYFQPARTATINFPWWNTRGELFNTKPI